MFRILTLSLLLAFSSSCTAEASSGSESGVEAGPVHAVCTLRGTRGNEGVQGSVRFTRQEGGVLIEAKVAGLSPGLHGFHIHEWGDVDCMDGKCAGGHFNPEGSNHGGPDGAVRHIGDMGNIEANKEGYGTYRRVDKRIQLSGPNGIIGRAVILHAGEDDLMSQPTGNAGARVAYGVIGIGKPKG